MEDKELQLESGNYTRIVNKVLDELVKIPLLGVELSICIFVIRKTWGYNKKSDQISISQFEQGIKRSRPTVVKALKNLQLVNILQLVKVGSSKSQSNEWKFNKKYKEWAFNDKLVNIPELVKYNDPTSKEKLSQLVKIPKHTKDNTKYNIQKKERVNSPHTKKNEIIKVDRTPSILTKTFFKGVQDLRESAKEKKPVTSEEGKTTQMFLKELQTKYPDAPKDLLWTEIQKFERYWTEKNKTGKKELWEMQKTFEVDRRLVMWFGRIKSFEPKQVIGKYQAGKVMAKPKTNEISKN